MVNRTASKASAAASSACAGHVPHFLALRSDLGPELSLRTVVQVRAMLMQQQHFVRRLDDGSMPASSSRGATADATQKADGEDAGATSEMHAPCALSHSSKLKKLSVSGVCWM